MQPISELLKERQNIILKGFDPVSAGGFTQVPNVLLRTPGLSSNAKVAYSQLLSYAWSNDRCFPGQDTMAQDSGISIATINRAIKELEQAGWLAGDRQAGTGEN